MVEEHDRSTRIYVDRSIYTTTYSSPVVSTTREAYELFEELARLEMPQE